MTTSELIAILQKADPSGQMKVVIIDGGMGDDSRFVSPLEEPDVGILTKELYLQKAKGNVSMFEEDIGKPFVAI